MAPDASLLTPCGLCVCGMLWLFFPALPGLVTRVKTLLPGRERKGLSIMNPIESSRTRTRPRHLALGPCALGLSATACCDGIPARGWPLSATIEHCKGYRNSS